MAAPPQAAGPEPQEAPLAGLVANVSGNVQKYAVKKKKILNAEELELYELTQAAGVVIDQEVFKVIVDLLKMNVAPLAVFQMLKSMCAGHRLTETLTSESASTTTQPSGLESREESFVSAKNSKIPAPLSFSSALRPPRLTATKIVVYSPADACSPLSQGPPGSFQFSCCLFSPFAEDRVKIRKGRNKPNPALQAERSSREGSSQRMSRQSSATRLQKSGSAGKNAGGSSTQT
ncbi:mitotic-spindle organizing protein 2 isoform X1 [Latimeria chalumnae]|uniref:mitotic-spindle organizing protein 2 isoform X1 n=1 Tax=Latimeria chalumnae TaxID=7897 RepID=UPI0003C1146C|nr:PREDICTED: mitotic-spindle organizing protein 2B-like isoform X1 [Latimeria chalumnae]|eukprot:XP_005990312.1 PREDICTED: mitotic-spindle organizing protein 2B-like isoform X1 [Latimeria chalumnae]